MDEAWGKYWIASESKCIKSNRLPVSFGTIRVKSTHFAVFL